MNLAHLYYFRTLAELEHFTKAAEQLYVAQSTLSNAMARLEEELGVTLFERRGRTVELTKYGREFQASVVEALNVLDKGVARAREHADRMTGTIDVGTVYTIQGDYLPALVRAYRDAYGAGLTVNLFQGLTLPLLEDLERGRYELAFTARAEHRPGLTFVPVLRQSLGALVHRTHPLAARAAVRLSDVAALGAPVVTYRDATPLGAKVARLAADAGIAVSDGADDEITIGSLVDASPDAVGLVLDTLGVAPFGDLTVVPLADVGEGFHEVCPVYRTCSYKSRAAEAFIELARSFSWPPEDAARDLRR